ncbi:hypothetical protein BBB56_20290 [Candidatus Pantoea deserta]|uniref:Uncharacterized protein n=1 Tax=Candidatus Pantoea deserta TaxID=1869313 RepID=A0A3N4NJR3_9GAMM|nr:hypothetical protein [Pantoea deserta]RPD94647.1 hypothetical protein BBB56_20290 [Pantoea deserta]
MDYVIASNLDELNELLSSGDHKAVMIGYELSADEFFGIAMYWGDRGAKIKRVDGSFLVKLGKSTVLPGDEI